MSFYKYQHIEKYGTMEVENIELGKVYVFPKIDGTNGSVWLDGYTVKAGSRNRELTLENDNQGFYEYIQNNESIRHYLTEHQRHRLFGEWLVPHTLKTYTKDAWRKFYVFDVFDDNANSYVNYDIYKEWLDEYNVEYIPAICSISNGDSDKFYYQLNNSTFLVEDGKGLGEGVVLKNYDFVNKYGRTTWAKIVRSEFKANFHKKMGHPEMKGKDAVELKIAEKYVTEALVDKVEAKIINAEGGWSSKFIPRLLNTVFYDLIREEMWEILKEFKYPTIDFQLLNKITINKIKEIKKELF